MTTSRFPRLALAVCLLTVCRFAMPSEGHAAPAPPSTPPKATGSELTLDAIFAPDGNGHTASQPAWSPDGRHLTYLWKDAQGEALWWLDVGATSGPTSGATSGAAEPELLFRSADFKGRWKDKESFAVDDYQWSPRGDSLLVDSGGDLFLFSLGRRELYRLTEPETANAENPKFSPQGDRVAYVRDVDLHVVEIATRKDTQLTRGGKKNVLLNGVVDWVYGEEIWNRKPTAYWWSPDGRSIAYLQFDESLVESYPIVDYAPKYPSVDWQKYPKAGEPNPRVRLGVIGTDAAEIDGAKRSTTWLQTGQAEGDYLARVAWTVQGGELRVERLNRDQTRLDLLRCSLGDGRCTPLLAEEHATWVNLNNDFRPLQDGRFLWSSEKSGWSRLYLYDEAGKEIRALTPEGWALESLEAVTEDGWAFVSGYSTAPLGATDRQALRVRIADGQVEKVATAPGTNSVLAAEKTGAYLHTWGDADHPNLAVVHRPDGSEVATLPRTEPHYDAAALPRWEYLEIDGPGGVKLPARLLKPAGFDPSRRYPAIVYHYGGPSSQVVTNNWDTRGRNAWHKWMATRGYAVFMVDNRSSLFFGRAGGDRDHRRMGNGNLEAQLAGVEYLKKLGWVDTSRLGLWGWSGGGANTLYCLFNAPGVWKAGVAGAPVTDWSLYDSIWTERYLDRPQDNPEGYRLSSPLSFAENLKDHLLLIHGTADDNVHPQNTIVLTDKLVKAKIPFEEAIYPRQKHGFKEDANRHFYERMTEFFDRTLGQPGDEVKVEGVEIREGKP
jgi:dipeptidyl-peptidase-4